MANVQRYSTASGATKYLVRVTVKGFKRTSRGNFTTERDAQEWGDKLEKELKQRRDSGGVSSDVATITLRQLVERFLADPNIRRMRWLPDLTQLLGEWASEYGPTRVREFGRFQAVAFRDKLIGKGLTFSRANRYVQALRRAWYWGTQEGYVLPSQPWPKGMTLKEPDPIEWLATNDEIDQVFDECDGVSKDLGMLVRFLVGTGARLSDALSVTWRDVDLERGDVAVRGQKTKHPIRVAMLAPAIEAVRAASKLRNISNPRVFWQWKDRHAPWPLYRKAKARFPQHLRSMNIHTCRHLCGSLLAANGATDVELAAQLGHRTLAMVKRYSHLRGGHRGAAHEKVDRAFGGRK